MNEEEKMNRCDYVIKNDETELLIPQVVALHEKLTAKAPGLESIKGKKRKKVELLFIYLFYSCSS
jgi:hypothetical protein